MSRPLRLEFPGAVYHVTSRGDRREPIYRDDADRVEHLAVLEHALDRFDAEVLAYCLMGNHYHLVLHTRQGNLSRLMRHLNGVYTQRFNQRHGLVGHLFQGRYKAIPVDRDAYLLALCSYVERNPVAAGLVAAAEHWVWSSCRAHLGQATPPFTRRCWPSRQMRACGRKGCGSRSSWATRPGASRRHPPAADAPPGVARPLARAARRPRRGHRPGVPRRRVHDERDRPATGAERVPRQPRHRHGGGKGQHLTPSTHSVYSTQT